MRKIALLTIPLLVLGLFSLSAEMMIDPTGVTVEVSGEATLTWGIDLDTNATGFKSADKSDLKVTIIPKQSTDTGMMMDSDDLYAYIELKDFKWEVTSADGSGKTTAPGITAKLIMGPLSIKTFALPDVKVDYVDSNDDDDDPDKEDEFPGPDFADVATSYGSSAGLTVAYDIDPVMLSLGVVSENDWIDDGPADKAHADCHIHDMTTGAVTACKEDKTDNQNDENAYAFLGTVNLDIGENADLEAKVAYAHEYSTGMDDIGIGAKATFNLGDITPVIAFDTAIPSDGETVPWDVGGSVKWNLSADEKSSVSTHLMMHSPRDGESKLYVSMSLVEGNGDEGALEGMGAELTVGLDDAAGDSNWNAKVSGSYLVEGIKPYFNVAFGSADDATTSFSAGLELTMISHLTTMIEYASDDIEADKGAVTTALKISY